MIDNEGKDAELTHEEKPPTAETTEVIARALVNLEAIGEMKAADLAALCRAVGLPGDGKADVLRKRLRAFKLGGDDGHVHGGTLCPGCRRVVRVTYTASGQYRRIVCDGPGGCGLRSKIPW